MTKIRNSIAVLLIMVFLPLSSFAYYYDCKVQSSSGHWLHYKLNEDNTAILVRENEYQPHYNSAQEGDLIIPATFQYGNRTYSVVEIESFAYDNTAISSVSIPNTVTQIGGMAFSGCANLTNIEIPNSVSYLDGGVFKNCTNLQTVVLGNNIHLIECETFYGCQKLQNINLNNVVMIGDNAFNDCRKLTSLNMPQIVSIGVSAFQSCELLQTIKLSRYITSIGDYAFRYCMRVNKCYVYTTSSIPSLGVEVFGQRITGTNSYNLPTDATLYVIQEMYDLFQNSAWRYYFNNLGVTTEPVSITEAQAVPIKITVANGSICLAGCSGHVAIYDVDGRIHFGKTMQNENCVVRLPKGLYIVKVGTTYSKKIILAN